MEQACGIVPSSLNATVDEILQDVIKAQCADGLLVPAWGPAQSLSGTQRSLRGLLYFVILCYLFVGISVIADK
jgi:hypothetical protein